MSNKTSEIISKAIDIKSEKSDENYNDLVTIASELDIEKQDLSNAIVQLVSQSYVSVINTDMDNIKNIITEFSSFKKEGFYQLEKNDQILDTDNIYLKIKHKGLSPIYSKPFYDLCIKFRDKTTCELTWKLNTTKFKESVFVMNSLCFLAMLGLTMSGIYQSLALIPLNFGLIFWSRWKADKNFVKEIKNDMEALNLISQNIKLIEK